MPAAIEAKGLVKRYGGMTALRNLDLTIAQGEVFGFLGPNGAGKSTTTKILTTLIQPSEGTARVGGYDVATDPIAVRRIVGYLPEKVPVWRTMTAREYLRTFARLHALPRGVREDRIDHLLDVVNLKGVDGKAVGKFSKGMTQRLGLARALLNEPKVLFLDEPASGLDPTGRKEIRLVMKRLAKEGTTIFLCTHDLAEAQAVCDRIGFIRAGELVKVQTVGDLGEGAVRVADLELDAVTNAVLEAVGALNGVESALQEGKAKLIVTFRDPVSRVHIAQAVHRAGSVVIGGSERAPSIETLYETYVEKAHVADDPVDAAKPTVPKVREVTK